MFGYDIRAPGCSNLGRPLTEKDGGPRAAWLRGEEALPTGSKELYMGSPRGCVRQLFEVRLREDWAPTEVLGRSV